jgi:hypothetical protein
MLGDNGFFAPVQYNAVWLILGAVLILLVVVWFVLVPLLTRARPIVSEASARAALVPQIRSRYETLISDVAVAHSRAELSNRQAHQKLSSLVRAFAHETSGYPASAMTLSELRALNLPGLTAAVEQFYPAEFGVADSGSVELSVAEARRVISDWSQVSR